LNCGGYPEQVLNPSSEYLTNLLEDILIRDVVRLHNIRKANLLKDIIRLIAASVGSRTSFNKLSNVLDISIDTVKEYIGFLETAFLIKPLEKWTMSYTEKVYAYKKFYFMDNGLRTLLTGKSDLGYKAENSVFLNLLETKENMGYYAESEREVDFVIGSNKNPYPIEVKYTADFDWHSKKYAGVKLFLHRYPQTKKVSIITKSTESRFKENKITVQTIPLWKFLLQEK
jgi:predicted AAA+ superfamily ATPase